ncbi:MATE family efflux transporter [Actinospica robiniae]|uniref:MATE family efflux transporter n=1 Tax=Actinospica robiniae TaxID=304901 RepID=UPI000422A81E|nr:MATE family efflux transporter [Actinospica robiniae]
MTAQVSVPALAPRTRDRYREIAALAAPIAFASGFALFAQWVIVVVIGRFGTQALYLRTLYLPLTFIFSAFHAGIDVSTQVAVARAKANDPGGRGLSVVVRGTAAAGFVVMAGFSVLLAVFAVPLAEALGAQPQSVGPFAAFVRFMCLAMVLEVPWLVLAGALRGWGRAGAASTASMTVMVLQTVTVYLLGGPGGLGVTAVPWSIVVAAVLGLALTAILVRRNGLGVLLTGRETEGPERFTGALRSGFGVLRSIGVPIGGTFLLLSLLNSAQLRLLKRFGDATVSGFGIGNATQTMVIVPAVGLGTAIAITVNQGGGVAAADVRGVIRRGLVIGASVYVPIGLLLWLGSGTIARFAAGTAPVAAAASSYLRYVGPTLACVGLMLVLLTVLEQIGAGFTAMTFNAVYFALSVGCAAWVAAGADEPTPFFATLAVANVAALLAIVPVIRHRIRRLTRAASNLPDPTT